MQVFKGVSLTINAPEFFQDEEFVKWLNNGAKKFTWHPGGTPSEWSDVVVLVDPGLQGEGSDSDMPKHIWEQIVQACQACFKDLAGITQEHIPVRLINISA